MHPRLFLYLLPFILFSCKKGEPVIKPEITQRLSSTRTINDNGHSILTSYAYNDKGQLYLETIKDETAGSELYQQYIHKDGQLHASEVLNDERKLSRINYSHSNGWVSKMRYIDYDKYQNTELNFELNFVYENDLLAKVITINSNGQTGNNTVYTFANSNITETKTYNSTGTLLSSDTYQYDDRLNPYYKQYGYLYSSLAYSKANIVKAIHRDYVVNTVTTLNYTYTYNKSNQPITQTLLGGQGKIIIYYTYGD
ncbi:hypothetical protein FPZ43_03565 [Mucilaginibacter pallidiroseus]|uniref:Uncharacterized protein n=1 Tax=Mucilaginibacter pallidiroseus TaxID=2599295 RepID=A0A563UJR7_9SPHI|nr:hypothetical protein [Mucilaginibacter pallidiroseus]TWR31563.1 hypothetical protein FPZ43_03565 [Mucilaginibacter pallidiroseus]